MVMAPRLALHVSPSLVASMELLALPWVELEQLVERELAVNPALERTETSRCVVCGAPLVARRCLDCAPRQRTAERPVADRAVCAEPTLADILLDEVRLQIGERDRPVAEYLLGSLDDRGFLDTNVDEVSRALGVSCECVRDVLACVQEAASPGVAARDVRECLLLQIERTCADLPEYELAREIVAHRLDELARGRDGDVADALGVDREQVLAARELIASRLRPYPILPAAPPWFLQPRLAEPEVLVREDARGFEIEILEQHRLGLAVSPAYDEVDEQRLTPDERVRVRAQVEQARSFVDRLDRRWRTIRAVAELVVERQRAFVVGGPRALLPLTRHQVAAELGVHESTVGRAVSGRHALLPSHRIVPMSDFFDSGTGARVAVADAVAAEPHPLSDGELVMELACAGFALSRRTVAKYRAQLGIPAHAHR
jgi:RNA polymerase sigma-54 factor